MKLTLPLLVVAPVTSGYKALKGVSTHITVVPLQNIKMSSPAASGHNLLGYGVVFSVDYTFTLKNTGPVS